MLILAKSILGLTLGFVLAIIVAFLINPCFEKTQSGTKRQSFD